MIKLITVTNFFSYLVSSSEKYATEWKKPFSIYTLYTMSFINDCVFGLHTVLLRTRQLCEANNTKNK